MGKADGCPRAAQAIRDGMSLADSPHEALPLRCWNLTLPPETRRWATRSFAPSGLIQNEKKWKD
eukprot:2036811-Rhodomonas_salina.1